MAARRRHGGCVERRRERETGRVGRVAGFCWGDVQAQARAPARRRRGASGRVHGV